MNEQLEFEDLIEIPNILLHTLLPAKSIIPKSQVKPLKKQASCPVHYRPLIEPIKGKYFCSICLSNSVLKCLLNTCDYCVCPLCLSSENLGRKEYFQLVKEGKEFIVYILNQGTVGKSTDNPFLQDPDFKQHHLLNSTGSVTFIKTLKKEEEYNLRFYNISKININALNQLSKYDFKELTYLDLEYSYINDKAVEQLSKCAFKGLNFLHLGRNNIGDKGVEHLSKCTFKELTYLNLELNKIGEKGLKQLSKCAFKKLNYLNLSHNYFGDKGVKQLSKCAFKELTYLNLGWNDISDKGVEQLSKCAFKELTYLNLGDNHKIGYKGVEQLSKCAFKELTYLYLFCKKIGEIGKKKVELIFKNAMIID